MDIDTMVKRTTIANSPGYIVRREEFVASSMSGHTSYRLSYSNWLRGQAADAWRRDEESIDYVVESFWTPIAWHTPERGWVHVGKSFSSRSSRHQSQARLGIHYDHDSRVEEVNKPYTLSEAQRTMLWDAINTKKDGDLNPNLRRPRYITVKGQARRTAAKLVELGLITIAGHEVRGFGVPRQRDNYVVTPEGINWSRS